jgi:Putative prokaryotic signal transducing protein
MSSFVTILTVPFPGNVSIIKARLESEGIKCFLKDDVTIQIDPLISNAVGGTKLQVKEEDAPQALEILYSQGYLTRESVENPDTYSGLKKFADQLPFFKKLRFEMRLLIWLLIILIIPMAFIIWIAAPSTSKDITEEHWSINVLYYKGKAYAPYSAGGQTYSQSIIFNKNGDVILPGFSGQQIKGRWSIQGKILTIHDADDFGYVYNGVYDVVFSNQGFELVLKSQATTIDCLHLP